MNSPNKVWAIHFFSQISNTYKEMNIIKLQRWCLFFGWRLSGTIGKHNAMIANSIAFRF